jgi:hypothetical protein
MNYQVNIADIELVMKYGPLGVKYQEDHLVAKSLGQRIGSYVKAIFSKKQDIHAILKHIIGTVKEINNYHKELVEKKEDCPDYLKAAFKVVKLWNKQGDRCGGFIQELCLRISGIKWRALYTQSLYIDFAIPAKIDGLNDIFDCYFSNLEELPLILSAKKFKSFEALHGWLKDNQDIIEGVLKEYGAVKFRGFKIETASQFEQIVEAGFGAETQSYIGGDGSRDKVEGAKNVYTATKAKNGYHIALHQERSVVKKMANRIGFFTKKAPRKGTGQTTLGKARDVTKTLMKKPIWKKFANRDLSYCSRHPMGGFIPMVDKTHKTVQQLFDIQEKGLTKSQVKERAEKICQEKGFKYKWEGDWLVKFDEDVPATRKDPNGTEQLWMNQVHFSKLTPELVGSVPLYLAARLVYMNPKTWRSDVSFADGEAISTKDTRQIFKTLVEHEVADDEVDGDLLLVHNEITMHGKAACDSSDKREKWTTICTK